MTATPALRILTALLSLSLLTSCVEREDADRLLTKGCTAGVNALLEDGQKIETVKTSTFTFDNVDAQKMRHVALTAATQDSPDETAQYECTFEEDFGLMGTNYVASLYSIKVGDRFVGKKDGAVEGNMQDFMKLNEAVGQVLHQK